MADNIADLLKSIAEVLLGIGGLSGLAATLLSRKKTQAETKKTEKEISEKLPAETAGNLVESSGEVIDQYKKMFEDYQKVNDKKFDGVQCEILELRKQYIKRISYLLAGIQLLTEQIINLGHEPCFTPTSSDLDTEGK